MKKHIIELIIIFGLSAIFAMASFASNTQNDISESLIRLHVIANSDSGTDQSVKYKVRDEILQYVSGITKNCKNIKEAETVVSENLDTMKEIADNVLSENGLAYSSEATLESCFFPTRHYMDFSLPAGEYNALRIKLGNASGKNWWCVLFPPLCISAAEAECEELLGSTGLSDEKIKLVTSDKLEYQFKFKIVELFEELKR